MESKNEVVHHRLTIAEKELQAQVEELFSIFEDQINALEKAFKSPSMANPKSRNNGFSIENGIAVNRGVKKRNAETPPGHWQLTFRESNIHDPGSLWQLASEIKMYSVLLLQIVPR